MQRRYRIDGKYEGRSYFVEFPFHEEGKKMAVAYRKMFAPFRHQRIDDIIQALPSKVTPCHIYDVETGKVVNGCVPRNK